ncbi:chitin disaccharide deacetylase [Tepidibacillus sp. LV47]|uniref:chitin disaccharide deacetylase n=1 Tax=Tepidibacillus sp. LV47 TaxID=3398228 RepID=UPI003AACE5EF
MKLIVNADDFGYSKGVNLGIIEAFKHGIVRSTSMMTNMPGTEHAISLMKENPDLGVGIHLVLTTGKPVAENVPSLVNDSGYFHSLRDLDKYVKIEDVEKEFTYQLEKFLSFGFKPTHIDSHHHVHTHEAILPIVIKLAEKYQLPVRKFTQDPLQEEKYKQIKTTDHFIYQFYGDNLTLEIIEHLLELQYTGETVELMCHPAYLDHDLLKGSSYNVQRVNELNILTHPKTLEVINKHHIELINYKHI